MSVFGGVAEFSCGRDVFFPNTWGFLLVLTRVGATQILTNQKVQNLKKKKRLFTHLFFLTASFLPKTWSQRWNPEKLERNTISWTFFGERWDFVLEVFTNFTISTKIYISFSTCLKHELFGPLAAAFVVSQFEVLEALHRSLAKEPLQGDAWPEKFGGLAVQTDQ